MKIFEGYEELTHGVLLVGYQFYLEDLAEGGDSLDSLMDAVEGLDVVACADLENTMPEDLEWAPLLFGVKIFTSFGGPEQERGFEWAELKSLIEDATEKVEAAREVVAEYFSGSQEVGTYLGCCGWLASAWCIYGEWDEEIDYEMRSNFDGGSFAARDGIYLYQGTDGACQESYPNGGVRGVWVAGDSFDGGGCATLEFSDQRDEELAKIVADADIEAGRYYFIAKYD